MFTTITEMAKLPATRYPTRLKICLSTTRVTSTRRRLKMTRSRCTEKSTTDKTHATHRSRMQTSKQETRKTGDKKTSTRSRRTSSNSQRKLQELATTSTENLRKKPGLKSSNIFWNDQSTSKPVRKWPEPRIRAKTKPLKRQIKTTLSPS